MISGEPAALITFSGSLTYLALALNSHIDDPRQTRSHPMLKLLAGEQGVGAVAEC